MGLDEEGSLSQSSQPAFLVEDFRAFLVRREKLHTPRSFRVVK